MGRAPFCDKNELKKGPWTQEEDQKLIDYIQIHGHGSWRTLPKKAGLERHGKSCRLRWTNYLRPDIKRGRFSFEEEEAIIQLHSILGNKWSAIAARLPGRTDNEIKNYWNTHIRKRLLQMGIDPVTHSPRLDLLDLSSILSSSIYNSSQLNVSRMLGIRPVVDPEILRLASTFFSSQPENRDLFLQNLPENQLCNPQVQNHLTTFQSNQLQTPVQEIRACTTSITPCAPVLNESQFIRTNVEQFPATSPNFSCQISEPNVWLNNLIMTSNFTENLVPMQISDNYSSNKPIIDPLSENSNIHSNTTNYNQFSFPLALSTSSSSPTPLNSSLTYVSSNIEDERDSYCSNILKFEIPDILEVNDFM